MRSAAASLLIVIIANFLLPAARATVPLTNTLSASASASASALAPVASLIQSGYHFQSSDTQSLQDDDFKNPGMLWVDTGRQYFNDAAGLKNQACASCHEKLASSVATTFPKMNQHLGAVVNLTTQIQHCRSQHQQAEPIDYESETALALTAYLANHARGQRADHHVLAPPATLKQSVEDGGRYFNQRRGQLNLSCHNCHQDSVGKMLRGDLISQGQSNGYPIYRLEWQSLGSLHRRFRACDIGVRAQPQALGSDTYINLEAYLKQRGAGLLIETPAVRR